MLQGKGKQSFLRLMGILSPSMVAQDRKSMRMGCSESHQKASAPSHSIQPELWVCLGYIIAYIYIYTYIYMHVWIYIHKYLCIALTKEKVKVSWRNESGAEARSSTRMPRLPLSPTPTVPPPMAGPYKSLAQATQKQRSCFHFKRNLLFPNWTNRAA